MNSHIAALWAKAFVHIAKLSEIAHTDRMNAQVEAKLARIRLGHLITHVSESQASADEDEFRRLDWIQTLSARMSGLLETIERNVNWFENCRASIPQGVTLHGSALDRELRTAAIEALERVRLSIEELAECCRVDSKKREPMAYELCEIELYEEFKERFAQNPNRKKSHIYREIASRKEIPKTLRNNQTAEEYVTSVCEKISAYVKRNGETYTIKNDSDTTQTNHL